MAAAPRDGNFVASLLVEDATTSVGSGSTLNVTGEKLTNAYPAHVAIVDGDGTQITSFNGGTVTVSGTVTVDATGQGDIPITLGGEAVSLSATDNQVLDNIDTNTSGLTIAGDGVKTVTTAGTDVVLGGDVTCRKVVIQAQTDNQGTIAVGVSGVDYTEATGTGIVLYPGDSISVETTNLNTIYIDASENGEGVRYIYYV